MNDRLRNIIGNCQVELSSLSDCLVVVLASYFNRHIDKPEEGEDAEVGDSGWTIWVERKTDEALDLIAQEINKHYEQQ